MLPKDYKVITWKERGVETEWDNPPRSMDEEPKLKCHTRESFYFDFIFGFFPAIYNVV